jgi:phytanoyl-CoA hydroxylase
MLTEQQVQQFQQDGYLRGGRVLNDAQVDTLRDEIKRVIDERERTDIPQPVLCRNLNGENWDAPVWQIVNIWEASPSFKSLLISSPQIAEEMSQLTQANSLRIWHDQIQYKPPKIGGSTYWHQDAPLWPIIAPMTEVSAWVALDDVDEENGCMWMVPGSHKWGNNIDYIRKNIPTFFELPKTFEGHAVEVRSCPVRKGEVHFHHALTWHGSPDNKSDRPRRAIAIHYMTNETRFVESGNHPMKLFVEVADGEMMRGAHFPLVWERQMAAA